MASAGVMLPLGGDLPLGGNTHIESNNVENNENHGTTSSIDNDANITIWYLDFS